MATLLAVAGVAKVLWFGVAGEFRALVMGLLGPSLQNLLGYCGGRFTLKTVLMIADQVTGFFFSFSRVFCLAVFLRKTVRNFILIRFSGVGSVCV